jgi:hypothetical protein
MNLSAACNNGYCGECDGGWCDCSHHGPPDVRLLALRGEYERHEAEAGRIIETRESKLTAAEARADAATEAANEYMQNAIAAEARATEAERERANCADHWLAKVADWKLALHERDEYRARLAAAEEVVKAAQGVDWRNLADELDKRVGHGPDLPDHLRLLAEQLTAYEVQHGD